MSNETNTDTEDVMVTGFEGDGYFTIVNNTGGEITNVRLSHYLSGSGYQTYASLAIVERLGTGAKSDLFAFHSTKGKEDHWCIAFQNAGGCWQSNDMKASMKGDYNPGQYKMTINPGSLVFTAMDAHTENASILPIYKFMGV